MGMTIDNSLEWLTSRKEHYEMDDNCQELAQALDMAIETMRKYQKIKEIIQHWIDEDLASESPSFADSGTIEDIIEVIEDGNVD